jgi:DNA-binding response OmpR family regulator
MPRLSGPDVYRDMRALDPEVRILFASKYLTEDPTPGSGHIKGLIRKPYAPAELAGMVRAALRPAE